MARTAVVVDLGGTHVRFAIASAADDGTVRLGEVTQLGTDDYPTFEDAWTTFEKRSDAALPKSAAIAAAGPVHGDSIEMTNHPWSLDRRRIATALGLDAVLLLNDLEAAAYAVAGAEQHDFAHIGGPEGPLPSEGLTSIIGLGTGLGTAMLLRRGGALFALPAEGGHVGFAPADDAEIRLLQTLSAGGRRVSAERVISGPAIVEVHRILTGNDGNSDRDLWTGALTGRDPAAVEAARLVCGAFGSFAGDLALTHGANGVVITGGLGVRLRDFLPGSGFGERFCAKGRFADVTERIPVKLLTMEQPGLIGAAIAFFRSSTNSGAAG